MAKLSVDQTLLKAKSHAKRGEVEEAHKLYHNVLQAFPKNGRAQKGLEALRKTKAPATTQNPPQELLHELLAHFQNGRYGDAEKLAAPITQEFPEHPFAWKVLGVVLGATGRKSQAEQAMQKAVALSPQDANTHNNLGVILQELGRLDEAEASFLQAIALKPVLAESHNNLGVTLKELGRLDEALASYNQAIALKPDYAEAHNNLGVTLADLGRFDEALASYNQAIALMPDYAEAHFSLGITLKELGRLNEALASYNQAIASKPDYAEAHNNLGVTLKELGRLDEALASYNQAIELKPDYPEAHFSLGNTLKELGRLDEALASYNQTIALKPDYAEPHNNLGVALTDLGRLDEALASYNQAIALKPDYAEAHRHLASIKKFDEQDEQYSDMLKLYLNEDILDEQRCHINFGLAKACEDLGNFEQAFVHYLEGNEIRKKFLKYDITQDVRLFRRIKSAYPKIKSHTLEPAKLSEGLTPIFIVGMPRSGTTLVEQIISSHSQITGAGELAYAAQFGSNIAAGFSEISDKALLHFRHNYLAKLENVSNGNVIISDKMPLNFRYIGLLCAAFPEAKIIHIKRNPAAVCWANFKQLFASKNMNYCYALDDIVGYFQLYDNLMEFWKRMHCIQFYTVDYELLTINQESETRQLIDYLGMDWDEKCLSPQNNKRPVTTASHVQVREKVYKGSSQQWKKYEPFLNGAFDSLLAPSVGKQPQD